MDAVTRHFREVGGLRFANPPYGLSQECIAKMLNVSQANVSKIEKRTDLYISTLRSHIRAMGGDLEIRAKFADGEVLIDLFSEDKAVSS